MINVRLRAIGVTEKPNSFAKIDNSEPILNPEFALKSKRDAYIPESEKVQEIPVFDGDKLTGEIYD